MKKRLTRVRQPADLRGFTLIETLVSLGILAIIIVIGSSMFFTILRGSAKTKILTEIKQNGNYAINVMERMIRNAKEIEACGSGMSKLTITNPDGNTTEFDLAGPKIASNSGSYLTSDTVKIDTAQFHRFDCTAGEPGISPDVVTINFTLIQAGASVRFEETAKIDFQTTVTLRNY